MIKKIMLIILGIFIISFFGILNTDDEFGTLNIFIKYPPTFEFYISSPPDAWYELEKPPIKLLEYEQRLETYRQIGIWNTLIPLFFIQLFLTLLFTHVKVKYKYSHLLMDIPLFIVSYFILAFSFGFTLFRIIGVHFYEYPMIILCFLLLFVLFVNYLIWRKLRDYLTDSVIVFSENP